MFDKVMFDFVIFGASGCTGKYCIEYAVKCLENEEAHLTWAIAGRDEAKLLEARDEVQLVLNKDLSAIPIIFADVDNEESLLNMCKSCKVLLNVVGPYRFYGEPVVRACIQAGTHLVDIPAELQYMENVQLQYHKTAEDAGIYVISPCGFDSLICEVAVNFIRDHFAPKILNSVEVFFTFHGGIFSIGLNHGTWDSIVYAVNKHSELKAIREQLFTQVYSAPWPQFRHPIQWRCIPFKEPFVDGWCTRFFNVDRAVAKRTQIQNSINLSERPVQVESYMTLSNVFLAFGWFFAQTVLIGVALLTIGRNLLVRFPRLCTLGIVSREEPNRERVLQTTFSATIVGKGWDTKEASEQGGPPNRTITGLVTAENPAYIATPICLIQSAITILREREKLPRKGGVFTPGVAFRRTTIADRLTRNGVTFKLSSD